MILLQPFNELFYLLLQVAIEKADVGILWQSGDLIGTFGKVTSELVFHWL